MRQAPESPDTTNVVHFTFGMRRASVTRSRPSLDPALLPEARMNRMRHEMWRLRRTVISLVSEPYRSAIDPPHNLTREESNAWLHVAAQRVIKLTVPDEMGKAPCPLCGAVPQFVGIGYSYPLGLERHLVGSHNSALCDVIHAAVGLQRVRHQEKWPDDYGPYGCD